MSFCVGKRKGPTFLAAPTELLGYGGLGHGGMVSCLDKVKSGNAALPQGVARKDAPKVCSS